MTSFTLRFIMVRNIHDSQHSVLELGYSVTKDDAEVGTLTYSYRVADDDFDASFYNLSRQNLTTDSLMQYYARKHYNLSSDVAEELLSSIYEEYAMMESDKTDYIPSETLFKNWKHRIGD